MLRGVHPREDHCEDNEKHNANQRFERLALLVLEVARRGCFVVAAFPAARCSSFSDMRAISKTSLICTREPGFRFERATVWRGAAFLFSLALERVCIADLGIALQRTLGLPATCRKEPQCPFSSGLRGDTTGLTGGKAILKLLFKTKV
jgi:hypothetical protein